MKQNLSTLSILHYVYGGMICLSGFVVLVFVFLGFFLNSDFLAAQSDPPPQALGTAFQVLGWVLFGIIEVWGILIILSGRWIDQRRNRTGSLAMAGFNCLNFPFGMALGIFTFVTLLNDEVEAEYGMRSVAAA